MRSAGRLLGVFRSEGPGGALARRLLPAVIGVLAVFGLLRWEGERAGLYGTKTGVVVTIVGAVAVLTGLLLYFGRWLDHHDAARREAEAGLRRSGRYFDLASDLLCTAGFDGYFKDLNAGWRKALGWSESELRSRPFVEFVHPDDREHTVRETAKLASGGVTVDFVNRYQAKDGGWRWLEWSARAAPDEQVIYASARDISERRLSERHRASQHETTRVLAEAPTVPEALPALLRAIGEHMGWPVGAFWTPNGNGSVRDLRCTAFWHAPEVAADEFEAATKRLSLAPGEGLPGRVFESRHPRWVPDVSVEPHSRRGEVASNDGLHACVLLPIVSGAAVLGVVELLSDEVRPLDPTLLRTLNTLSGEIGQFLERKRGEAALAASERQTRQILETAFEAFISMDERARITYLNPQAEAVFGWSCEEVVGRELADTIIPERYREAHRNGIERFLATGEGPVLGKPLELSALHRDGREFPVELTISALETEDGHSFNAFLRDITERKCAQDELAMARDQALAATKQKSEFLANMSHEIRTPMNAVIGMTALLLDTQLDAGQREYAETVRGSGEALLTIINDILDFSKIEAGQLDLEVIDFDLRAVIEDVADLLAERAHGKGLELAALVPRELPAAVRGDPGRLRQVLTNLVGNAIKFTEAGEVVIRVEPTEETAEELVARFEVADTGVGIPPAAQPGLFEAFTQADASTTRSYGGTGLGLAISQQLVELMGGEIALASEPGQGSTFTFTIRLGKQREPPPGPSGTRPHLAGLRVLIVDDNATNRTILEHQVSAWGMHRTSVEGGEAALRALRAAVDSGAPFDVALLDKNMPGIDGLDLARAIADDPVLSPTRLVLLTSSGERGTRDTQQAGVAAYLSKPVHQSQLYDCLATATGAGPLSGPPFTKQVSETRPLAGPRLLVAEDNEVNQQVAIAMLTKLGYDADIVSNGREAVAALSGTRYGAILMDCQMPDMDGYAATAQIRKSQQGPDRVPIIAMTASAVKGDREKCLAIGMDDYISKPVAIDALEAVLERWVSSGGETEASSGVGSDVAPERGEQRGATPASRSRHTRLLSGVEETKSDMAGITITSGGPREFEVQLREGGGGETRHHVTVPEDLIQELQLPDDDLEDVVRKSFEFLLEREPASSIMSDFSLDVIARYFPEYPQELSRRL